MTILILALGLALSGFALPEAPSTGVTETRTIGRSVQDRAIDAYRLGAPSASTTVVALGLMHGNEPAPRATLEALRDGPTVTGLDLWVIPILNPDGAAADIRANANGVDLNRNFPAEWLPEDPRFDPGPEAASEPETRAIVAFLDEVDPDVVVSLHQPYGVVDTSESKFPDLAEALGRELGLPLRHVDCTGPCHGTLTGWFNATHAGEAITVEFGAEPTPDYLTETAPRGLLSAVGGRRSES